MKRMFFIVMLSILTLFVYSQTFTVTDTTLQSDPRINFLISTIAPAIQKNFSEEMARQKVNGEVTYEAETIEFMNDLNTVIQKYAMAFIRVDTVVVDTTQIVQEFNKLNEKIAELQSDPDIKYIEAVQEFKNIQERQEKLAKYYQQIQTKVNEIPSYIAWKQPAGAHDAYKKGERVLFKDKVWENIMENTADGKGTNVWAPNVTGWREITK